MEKLPSAGSRVSSPVSGGANDDQRSVPREPLGPFDGSGVEAAWILLIWTDALMLSL